VLHRAGRLEEAEREYRAGLAARERHAGPDHPELTTTLMNLATLLTACGDLAEAHALYRRALRLLDGAVAAGHPRRRICLQRLAELDTAA
jgi:tetratricopeptide (TPR) repeat protein